MSFVQDVDPEELACQLTLTEQRLYNAIRPYELLAHVRYYSILLECKESSCEAGW